MRREKWWSVFCSGILVGSACVLMTAIIAPAIVVMAEDVQTERQTQGLQKKQASPAHLDRAHQSAPLRTRRAS